MKPVLSYLAQVKDFMKRDSSSFQVFQKLMEDFRNRRIGPEEVAERMKELFKDRKDLLVGFNAFLPEGYKIRFHDLDAALDENARVQATVEFLNKAKLRFKDDESVYQSLLDALNGKHKGTTVIYKDIAALLVGQQDLLEEFNRIKSCSDEKRKVSKKEKRKVCYDHDDVADTDDCKEDCINKIHRKGFVLFEKFRHSLCDSNEYLKFLMQIHEFNRKRTEIGDVVQLMARFPVLKGEFEELLNECQKQVVVSGEYKRRKIEEVTPKRWDRYRDKSIQELDFSNCESSTPSYWEVPEDFVVPKSSQRSDLEAEVLNNQWVCRTSGKGNFKTRHVNKHQQALNNCEDYRYEADMLFHLFDSTVNRINELLRGENKISFESPFNIKDHLSILHLRCLERLYHGSEMKILDKNPEVGLTVIFDRLEQKLEEFKQDRNDLNNDLNKKLFVVYARLHKSCS